MLSAFPVLGWVGPSLGSYPEKDVAAIGNLSTKSLLRSNGDSTRLNEKLSFLL